MADRTGESPSGEVMQGERHRTRLRTQRSNNSNVLRPSPALVSWIDRAVSRFTTEASWAYSDGMRPAATATQAREPDTRGSRPAVPDEVRDRFVRVGHDYYFPSGARAFRDHGQKVVTPSENVEVVRTLVQIAMARGWQDITVSGSDRFRREAWRVATVSGLVVRGYRPSEFEKQKLVRELGAAREPRTPAAPLVDPPRRYRVEAEYADDTPRSRYRKAKAPVDDKPLGPDRADARSAEAPASEAQRRVYSGTLIKHGPAPYEFHPHGEPSYFVRLQTQRGEKLLWGKDLERALADSKAKIGDEIRVRQAGRETVTVKRKERDATGRVTQERDVKTHRNQWEIRAGNRESVPEAELGSGGASVSRPADPEAGANDRGSPDVQGALLALKGAQLFANRRIADPAQRTVFMNAVRAELVTMLNRGEAPVPQLRDRELARRPADPARTLS